MKNQKINNFNFTIQKKFFVFDLVSEIENLFIKSRNIEIDRPIFICGMPRSGTTFLLNLINNSNQVSSCTYGQLPFFKTPLTWNFFKKFYYFGNQRFARLHDDGLQIDIDSPDAFEELIWAEALEKYNEFGFCRFLDETYSNHKLKKKLYFFIKKIIFINKKERYLSKGNYNVFRLNYIVNLFKDCKIILCYRNPSNTACSSERVHNRFLELSKKIVGFNENLHFLSHFEFGKNRKAIKIENNSFKISTNLFEKNKNYEGYLHQWISLYQMIHQKYLSNQIFSKNLVLLNYDKFILDLEKNTKKLFSFCELDFNKSVVKNNNLSKKQDYNAKDSEYNFIAERLYNKLKCNEFNFL